MNESTEIHGATETRELKNILQSTKVGETTLKGVPQLSPHDTVADAAEAMRVQKHGSALVCEDGKLVGIFTERDWLRVLESDGDGNQTLSELMTAQPQTLTTQDPLFQAIRLMDEGGYRRVPVIDESGSPFGIVDVKTIVHFLVEQFPEAVYNQASTEQLTAKHREGA